MASLPCPGGAGSGLWSCRLCGLHDCTSKEICQSFGNHTEHAREKFRRHIGFNLVPRARVTLVQRNGNEGLWDKAFQIAVSLVENLSMRSRAGGQISFPEPALLLWALETRLFLTQTGLGTNNKMAKKMRVSVLDRLCLSHLWMQLWKPPVDLSGAKWENKSRSMYPWNRAQHWKHGRKATESPSACDQWTPSR